MEILILGKTKTINDNICGFRNHYNRWISNLTDLVQNCNYAEVVSVIKEREPENKRFIEVKNKQREDLISSSKFIADLESYRKDDKGLNRVQYFQTLGYENCDNAKEFQKVYSAQIKMYDKILKDIEDSAKEIWTEEEFSELKNMWDDETERLENIRKAQQEAILKEREVFLYPFKNGCQRCVCLVNERTHHLENKEDEINLYLSFGYELETNLTKTSTVFLKPSNSYKYSNEFEQALLAFKESKKENKYVVNRWW